ncbi:MAG: imidazole glycerol phosphate synthase, glutamine amidotransferase subunit [Fibrobacteres bacterium]|nr:imidazole glycerol phosphate synthase, glutamine amidotransferase subunit [Fibrobacterota bacterium]
MIVIVDYKAGNLTSVQLALAEVGEESVISSDPAIIAAADHLVFPGVGAAGSAMEELRRMDLEPVLKAYVATGKPFLGICVGCQIIMDWSLEDGRTDCLGLLPGGTDIFAASPESKVPHMGWNQIRFTKRAVSGRGPRHPLVMGIPDGSEFYFVHSYFPTPADTDHVLALTDYGGKPFASILGSGNIAACQFHVEKSGRWGLALLKNFCRWDGRLEGDGVC